MKGARATALALAALAAACTLEERTDNRPVAATQPPEDHHREVIQPPDAPRLPVFSSAVRTGNLLFLSGALGALPGVNPPQLVEGGVEAETRQTFANIESVLDAAGLTLQDVVKCTVFLADIADYAAVNSVYVEYWNGDPPARSAIAGSGLALGAKVEIECIAAFPPGR
jgi:2-iminobutanoate/2-iminopropanoate deaminase